MQTLTTRVASFTSTIAQREQLVTQVIGNLNTVLDTVDGRREELSNVIAGLDTVLTNFDQQDTEILIAADRINGFARQASDLVSKARADLTPDLRALTVAARGLNMEKKEQVDVAGPAVMTPWINSDAERCQP